MLPLALTMALSQLVPAPAPDRAPPAAPSWNDPDLAPSRAALRGEADEPDPERNWAPRLALTTLTAAGATGLVLGLSVALERGSPSSGSEVLVLSLTALPFTALIASAGALGVHRLEHGRGSIWASFGGLIVGAMAGLTLYAGVLSLGAKDTVSLDLALTSAAAVLTGLSTAAFLEWSHWRALAEQDALIGLAPVRGGAVASLGWRF